MLKKQLLWVINKFLVNAMQCILVTEICAQSGVNGIC